MCGIFRILCVHIGFMFGDQRWLGDWNGGRGGRLGSSFSVVPHHIFVWSTHGFLYDQVVQHFINSEVRGGETNMGALIVPNLATIGESMVLVQKVEGVPESWDMKYVPLLYPPK